MSRSPLWREFESGESFPVRALRVLVLAGSILFLFGSATIPLTWQQQFWFAALTLGIAFWIDARSQTHRVTLMLILVSVYSTGRYGFWRLSTTLQFFRDPGNDWTGLDVFFIWMLLLAEGYAFAVLLLGYLQMLWPLRRAPVAMPENPSVWPAVDLIIPTYNEPLSVVRFTALAARNIDWPAEKLHIYILDDGNRAEYRAFADAVGVGYITREDNRHAKAGNINHALKQLSSPYVAVFDSDHVPTRSFLQLTMGWFLRDGKLALLQTPHHFYSPDPFERNLGQFRLIPNENELFYGVVQDGNDFWNSTFFCGSCAVLRREALDEVGGVAAETVTEDAHTSLRLQMRGWNTAYLNIPQAAGLATERLSAHIKQRIRWARGMVQILRIDNPLLAPGLRPAQRLCYFNAMSHFLYALPRLIFLIAPLIYLVFGHITIPGYWATIMVYAGPHLVMSNLTNSRVQGQHRHSFWNEIYETVLAPYIFLPTLLALINPRLGQFNVTAKGGVVRKGFFDARIARPTMLLLAMNLFGLACALPRFFQFPTLAEPWFLGFANWPASLYDGGHRGTIAMNVLWTLFNLTILGVAAAVAWESQQRRQAARVAVSVAADVILADGSMLRGVTADLSSSGVRAEMDRAVEAQTGEAIHFSFPGIEDTGTLRATVIDSSGRELRARFAELTLEEEETLTMVLYSRADRWLGWGEAREADRPLHSMGHILKLSLRGLTQTAWGLIRAEEKPAAKPALTRTATPLVLFAVLVWACAAGRAATLPEVPHRPGTTGAAGSFGYTFSLRDAGVPDTIELRGVDAHHSVYFAVPQNQIVRKATMRLRYHLSPALLPKVSQLNVSLNGTLVASLPVTARASAAGQSSGRPSSGRESAPHGTPGGAGTEPSALLEATLRLPPELLVRSNQLSFEFIGHYTTQCEDPSNTTLWSHIDANSTVELAGSLLPLPNNLNQLPLPFYDATVHLHPSVPIVFLSQPSHDALHAAGILASWFGILSDYRGVRFPVSIGKLPAGDAIVIAQGGGELPEGLKLTNPSGPTVGMFANPSDPASKVLVVSGDSGADLVKAAVALSLRGSFLEAAQEGFADFHLPAARTPDDAPRWLSTEPGKEANIGQIAQTTELQGDGSVPMAVYLRVPPDLFYGETQNLPFHLSYRYNGIPLADQSSLQVSMNSAYVSSTPMPHRDKGSIALDTVVPVPVVTMRPFSNTMLLKFLFQIAKKGQCEDSAPLNLQGAVLKDSYLDLTGIAHWTALPNLELFANAGYPFTRLADLAETAVVLPGQPTAEEMEVFLTLMGHFGAQTGYPVLNVTVTDATGMAPDGGKDYLVLGGMADQPALQTLAGALPVQVGAAGLRLRDADSMGWLERAGSAWDRVWGSLRGVGQLSTSGGLPDALIEAVEWPQGSSRSVVVVALREPALTSSFLASFLQAAQSSEISQSVSVLRGAQFSSYHMGGETYHVGKLSLLARTVLIFSTYPWLLVLLLFLVCFLLATLLGAQLRRHARLRLQGGET